MKQREPAIDNIRQMRIENDDFADRLQLTVAIGELAFPQQRMGQVLPDEAARARSVIPAMMDSCRL